ncbi:MAG: DUF2934 domain-containing protein [Bryobacterales bacterium]|nr:DUF2934 domain-containing protein [Bryobacterales bacterium]
MSFLRHKAAYFRWCDRGRPEGDSLADWLWAEEAIPILWPTKVTAEDDTKSLRYRTSLV